MSFDIEIPTELLDENRLRWACRRGMLELDILLGGFIDNGYSLLSRDEKLLFQDLLIEADQDLYDYFMNNVEAENEKLANVIKKVRHAAAT